MDTKERFLTTNGVYKTSLSKANGLIKKFGGQVKDYWPVLNYEIQMYFGARHLQGFPLKGLGSNINVIQTSAMTEVKALHIRILTDMFSATKKGDDINIDDIIPDWREKNRTVAHNLGIAYTNKLQIGHSPKWCLNKYLVHPDKRRGDHFNWTPVINRMDPPLKNVFKTLPMEKLEALKYFRKYLDI